jgi:hypothetical protein
MSWIALAGNVLTYGDTFDDLPAEYVDVYRRVLPPLPVAGRPLDLWENEEHVQDLVEIFQSGSSECFY